MSRGIAFGGILTALCTIFIYFGAYMPSGQLAMYALSSAAVAIAVVELGIRSGAVVYVATAMLAFLFLGNFKALLLFTLFFGSYPLIKYFIEKQKSPMKEMLLKFACFNLLILIGYYIYKLLLGVAPVNFGSFSIFIILGLIAAAQLVFLIYDYVLSRLINYYIGKIKSALRK